MKVSVITAGGRKAITLDDNLVGSNDDYSDDESSIATLADIACGLATFYGAKVVDVSLPEDMRDWDDIIEDMVARDKAAAATAEAKYPLSDEAYLTKSGSCPLCGSDEIEGNSVEIDGNEAFQEISCGECDGEWMDSYKLTGYAV